eukprot:1143692-Pelagomonas_calceolata.AAC.2
MKERSNSQQCCQPSFQACKTPCSRKWIEVASMRASALDELSLKRGSIVVVEGCMHQKGLLILSLLWDGDCSLTGERKKRKNCVGREFSPHQFRKKEHIISNEP